MILAGLIAIFIGIIGLIAVAPSLLDQERLRVQFLNEAGQLAASELQATGKLRISMFPEFKATLSQIASVDANAPIHIMAEKVEIGLSPWPALLGKIETSSIQFTKADVTIRTSAALDLQKILAKSPLNTPVAMAAKQISADAATPDLSSISNRKLGLLGFTDSSLSIIASDGTKERVSRINGSLQWPDLYSAARFVAVADWRGESVELTAEIARPLLFAAGGNSDIALNINSEPMTVVFKGKSNLVANFYADGNLSLKAPSLQKFLRWIKAGSTAGEAIGEIELDAKLNTKNGKLYFDELAMLVAGSPASGALEIDPVATPIKTSGTLAFKSVDLAALALSLPIRAGLHSSQELMLLDKMDLDLRLSAEEAKVAGYSISNAAGAVRIAKGDVSLDLGTGTIAGGTIMGRLELSGSPLVKAGRLTLDVNDIHQDQVENLPIGMPVFAGALSGKFAISGPYVDLKSLLETGEGTLKLNFATGVIRNFNLESFQAAMEKQGILELPSVYAGMSEAKPFEVSATLKSGVVVLHSANAMIGGRHVSVSGAIPLLSRGIALNGVISNAEQTAAPKSLPFFIGGTWAKPLVITTPK
jgi:AsmA protein